MSKQLFISFDWDGVLHKDRSFRAGGWDEIDLTPLAAALRKGWRVAIMTANDRLEDIAAELRRRGYKAYADYRGRFKSGMSGDTIVVSGHKLWADVFVDDRAINFQYGEAIPGLVEDIELTAARKAVAQARGA